MAFGGSSGTLGKARVVLEVDKRGFNRDLDASESKFKGVAGKMGKAAAVLGGAGVVGGLIALGKATKMAAGEFSEAAKVGAQTEAVLKSTGASANVTAGHVEKLATSLMRKSGVDDELIQKGSNMLLTFTKVRNEVGKGNDIFDQATKTTLDMSVALGTAAPRSAMMLGKALNDPIKGITALRRVGVAFTEQQENQIKALVKSGRSLDAQKMILKELQVEFGGSAEAAGKTLPGQLNIMRETLRNAAAEILSFVIPKFAGLVGVMGEVVGFIDRIASAPSLSIAVDIAGKGLQSFGGKIKDSIERAISATDWADVGDQLGKTIGASLVFTADTLNNLLNSLFKWLKSHTQQIAEFGAEMAVRVVLTLTDPIFWAKHLDLLLLLIGAVLFKGMGRVALTAVRALGAPLAAGLSRIAGEVSLLLMRGIARLPGILGDAIALGGTLMYRAIIGPVGRIISFLMGEFGKIPGLFGRVFRFGIIAGFFRLLLEAVDKMMGVISSMFGVLGKMPGRLGQPFRDAQGSIDGARAKIEGLKNELTGVKSKKVNVDVNLRFRTDAGGGYRDGVVGLDSAIQEGANAVWQAGGGGISSTGTSSSSSGLSPWVSDELAIGQMFGLRLSSGLRPGSITSSGRQSLHSVGQAIDMAGPASAMAMYAQSVAGRSGVAEVIYTPVGAWYPGAGWTRPSGQIAAGHYDHVHVGVRGGDGRVPFTGGGVDDDGDWLKPPPGGLPAPPSPDRGGWRPPDQPAADEPAPLPGAPGGQEIKIDLPMSFRTAISDARYSGDKAALIGALKAAKGWLESLLGNPWLTPEQRMTVQSEITEYRNEIAGLEKEDEKDAPGDPDSVPEHLDVALAEAEMTDDTADDLAALRAIESWYQHQLAGTTGARRARLLRALKGVRDQIKGIVPQRRVLTEEEVARQGGSFVASVNNLLKTYGGNLMAPVSPSGGGGGTPFGKPSGMGDGPGIPPGEGRGGGGGKVVVVNQNFNKPPEDIHPLMRSAEFAAANSF